MTRLDRYVLGRFLTILSGCLLAIAIVFVAVDYIGAIRIWNDRSALDIREYYIHSIPYILFLVSPIAVLLSAMFTVAGLARRLELAAMFGAGRPLWRVLLPIWIASVAYSGFWVWASRTILPHSNHERIRIRPPKKNVAFTESPYRMDFAVKTGDDGILFFRDYSGPTSSGTQVVFTRNARPGQPIERIDARSAHWKDSTWMFRTGRRRIFDTTGNLASFASFDSIQIRIPDAKPENLITKKTYPDEMTHSEIGQKIQALRRSGEPATAWEAEAEFKRSGPWVTAIVSLIGTALAALVGRRGQALAFGIGIFLAFTFYVAVRAGLALGHAGHLTALQAAWAPHAFFLCLGVVFLWRASRT
jgi:lipopolysaccharide export system permease protein